MSWELATLEALEDSARTQLTAHLCANAQNWMEARRQMLVVQEAKIAEAVHSLGEISANRNMGGFRPEYEVPLFAQEYWRTKFLLEDRAAGINHTTGYECWSDREFVKDYKKRNPHLVYREEKKGNSIIMPATKWTRIEGRAA